MAEPSKIVPDARSRRDRRFTARCRFCGRRVQVIDPQGAHPYLTTHRIGGRAELRGGQSPQDRCDGSLLAADLATIREVRSRGHLPPQEVFDETARLIGHRASNDPHFGKELSPQ
jgi:hypothetical protein